MTSTIRPTPRRQYRHGDRRAAIAPNDRWGAAVSMLIVTMWIMAIPLGFRAGLTANMVLGLVLVIFGLRKPVLGLMGIGIVCVLDSPARVFLLTGGLLRWNTLNYLLAGVGIFYLPLLVRLRNIHMRWIEALIALLMIEVIPAPDLVTGIQQVLYLTSVLGIFVYFARAVTSRDAWYWMAVAAGLAGAGAGLLYYPQEAILPYINENAWSVCSLSAVFATCMAFRRSAYRRHGQLVIAILATVNGLWVFLSGSRGSLALGIICGIFLLLQVSGIGRRVLVVSTACLIGVGVLAQYTQLQDRTLHRVTYLLNPNASVRDRTSGRSDLARGGLMIFEAHPLGVGTGGFADSWENLDISAGVQSGKERQAHAAWIKILAENGIPGLAILFGFTLTFAYVGLGSRYRSHRRLGLFVSIVLSVAFLTTEFQPKGLWFLAAGAAALLGESSIREVWPRRTRSELGEGVPATSAEDA